MSRKKRRSAGRAGERRGGLSPRWSRRALVGIATLVAVLAVALFLLARSGTDDANAALIDFPPWPNDTAPAIAFEHFTGAEACAECHRTQHDAWSGSTHGRAGGLPARARLLRAFDGTPIRFRDATVTPRVLGADHVFVVAQPGREEQVLRVDGVVGGGHMVGGGTQGFVMRYEDGTLRLLPFELVRREDVWFCNSNTRLNRGWIPITPDMALADCGDWPPVRVLGESRRFATCQGCHGSQIDVRPEPGRPHATRMVDLRVNCESCHGPGGRHVELARGGSLAGATDIGMTSLATLSTDASLQVCFQCHALKDALSPGYLPGRDFNEYYSLKLPLLGDSAVWADGRTRTFAYQQGHLYSDCYRNGSLTCVDCHEPHGQGYRDVTGRALPGRFDDAQCTGCHASKAVAPELHTHHAQSSEGSRCVSCHMPYLQEPEVGNALRYARSDHTIPIPRPTFDAGLGAEVACQLCHTDRSVATLQADIGRWWGELKPQPRAVAALSAMGERSITGPDSRIAGARELLDIATDTADRHDMARFAALGELLLRESGPDAAGLDGEAVGKLSALAGDRDDDIAAAALAVLHQTRGEESAIRRLLVNLIGKLDPRERAVRARWAVLLGFIGDRRRAANDPPAAVLAYRRALEVRPDHAPTVLNLGLAYAQQGDYSSAEQAYARSIRLDESNTLAYINLGIARAARGDEQGAAAAYREAIAVDPADPLPHFNLGNVFLRAGDARQAIEHYERATLLDPSLAPAHFNLARAHLALHNMSAARDALTRGLEFDPRNDDARRLLAQLEAAAR